MALIEKSNIPEFLPQADPFVMVDALVEQDETKSISSFTPGTGHFFANDSKFKVAGMLENIAQTAALRSGYSFSQMKQEDAEQKKPPVGFIGSVKKMKLSFLPDASKELKTTITVKHTIGQISVIEGVVEQGAEALKCEMNIFLQE